MNRQDDTSGTDAELSSYLEGKDGVSAAYRASSAEMPSAALDAAILQAARASLRTTAAKPPKAPALRNYYSLAASLMLGMMLGAVLFRGDNEAPVAITASAPQGSDDFRKTVVLTEESAGEVVDSAATQAVPELPAAAQAEAFAAQEPPAPASDAVAPPAPAGNSEFRERTLPAPPPPIVTRNVGGTSVAPPRTQAQAQAARVESTEEEITVTGSRIFRLSYRDNQEDWLREMLRMSEQLEDAQEDMTTLRETLELERAEFSAEYPDVPLDQALRELRGR